MVSSILLLTLSVSFVSCNEAGQFSKKVSSAGSISVSSPDVDSEIFCSEAKDLDACLAQKDLCQPAFEDVLEGADKPYAGCIPNPNVGENNDVAIDPIRVPVAPIDPAVLVVDEPVKVPVAPIAPVVVAEPVKIPVAPVDVAEPVKVPVAPVAPVIVAEPVKVPVAPVAPVIVAEPVKVPVAPVAPVVVADPVKVPVIPVAEDVVKDPEEEDKVVEEEIDQLENAGDCSKLDPKYIFSKDKGQIKVKICHASSDGFHAIIVACPALKAHLKHKQGKDYLGACSDE
jgi:hypothetical protein